MKKTTLFLATLLLLSALNAGQEIPRQECEGEDCPDMPSFNAFQKTDAGVESVKSKITLIIGALAVVITFLIFGGLLVGGLIKAKYG